MIHSNNNIIIIIYIHCTQASSYSVYYINTVARCLKGESPLDCMMAGLGLMDHAKSARRGECVTSTDDVAMAMRLADELDTEGRGIGNC